MRVCGLIVALVAVCAAEGESLAVDATPGLLTPKDSFGVIRRLEPDRMLISGGLGVRAGSEVSLKPEFGLSHVMHLRELGGGYGDVLHRIHAQAGGKVSLFDRFYLGLATKLPIYNYEMAEGRMPGGMVLQPMAGRHDYELLRLSADRLTWTGEMGLRLGRGLDLNLYYDQNQLKTPLMPGITANEEVIGTRFIFRFK